MCAQMCVRVGVCVFERLHTGVRVAGSLAVKSVGPVTERSLVSNPRAD